MKAVIAIILLLPGVFTFLVVDHAFNLGITHEHEEHAEQHGSTSTDTGSSTAHQASHKELAVEQLPHDSVEGPGYEVLKAAATNSGRTEIHVHAEEPRDLVSKDFYNDALAQARVEGDSNRNKTLVYLYKSTRDFERFTPFSVGIVREDGSWQVGFYTNRDLMRGSL